MSNDVKWVIISSGRYMFVRFDVNTGSSSKGFLAKIHYGKEIITNNISTKYYLHLHQWTDTFILSIQHYLDENL